jgi:hypothetical protein
MVGRANKSLFRMEGVDFAKPFIPKLWHCTQLWMHLRMLTMKSLAVVNITALSLFICLIPQAVHSEGVTTTIVDIARVQGRALPVIYAVCAYTKEHDGLDCASPGVGGLLFSVSTSSNSGSYLIFVRPSSKATKAPCFHFEVDHQAKSVRQFPCHNI